MTTLADITEQERAFQIRCKEYEVKLAWEWFQILKDEMEKAGTKWCDLNDELNDLKNQQTQPTTETK